MTDRIIRWIIEDVTWGGVLFGASLVLVTTLGSLLVVGFLLVKLPSTYFQEFHRRDVLVGHHPALRFTARSAKHALGAVLVVVGTIMVLPGVPGPGLLIILVGLVLFDLTGKRRLERRIVGRPRLLRAINRLRKRFGRPPLVLGSRRGEVWRRHRSRTGAGSGAATGRTPVA
jgi:hypothetical protein